MPYVAIINTPGYLPETEPEAFEKASDAWQYLLEERERLDLAWEPLNPDDPEGPQQYDSAQQSILEHVQYADVSPVYNTGTVYADNLAYSVDWSNEDE